MSHLDRDATRAKIAAALDKVIAPPEIHPGEAGVRVADRAQQPPEPQTPAVMTDEGLINGLHDWHTYLGSYDKGPLIEQSAERIAQLAAENARLTELVRRLGEVLREIRTDGGTDSYIEKLCGAALALTDPKP